MNEMKYFFGAMSMYMGFIVWCYDGTTEALERCKNLGDQVRYIYKTLGLEYNPNESFGYFRKTIIPHYAANLAKTYSWKEYLEFQDPLLLLN